MKTMHFVKNATKAQCLHCTVFYFGVCANNFLNSDSNVDYSQRVCSEKFQDIQKCIFNVERWVINPLMSEIKNLLFNQNKKDARCLRQSFRLS